MTGFAPVLVSVLAGLVYLAVIVAAVVAVVVIIRTLRRIADAQESVARSLSDIQQTLRSGTEP